MRPVRQGNLLPDVQRSQASQAGGTKPVSQEKKGGMFLVDCCRLLPEGQFRETKASKPEGLGQWVRETKASK